MLKLLDLPKASERKRKSLTCTDGCGGTHTLASREGYISWPAWWDGRRMTVLISLRELARLAGLPFPMTERQITAALKKHEDLIETRAGTHYSAISEILLGDGSLSNRAKRRPARSRQPAYSGPPLEGYARLRGKRLESRNLPVGDSDNRK